MTTHRLRNRLFAAALAVASFAGIGAASLAAAGPANADVTIGNVTSFARPYYDACNHVIKVLPATNERLRGDPYFTTYFRTQGYDYATGRWTSVSDWKLENGLNWSITSAANPYPYLWVQYAKVVNGTWTYRAEWAPIEIDSVDNLWCNTFQF